MHPHEEPPVGMQLMLLSSEEQVMEARRRFPLFYDACLPSLPHDPWGELRTSVVADANHTVLAILEQQQPFQRQPVRLAALVVGSLDGLCALLRFLQAFLARCHAHGVLSRVSVPHSVRLFTADGIGQAEVHQALVDHAFAVA